MNNVRGGGGGGESPQHEHLHSTSTGTTYTNTDTNTDIDTNTYTDQANQKNLDKMLKFQNDLEKYLKIGNDSDNDDDSTNRDSDGPINFVFSDVDGTLVHYPSHLEEELGKESSTTSTTSSATAVATAPTLIHLPPSSTGMKGIISSSTLRLCQILRKKYNVKLTLVSGMRTSTLLKRLPYLPKADAYASEAGGRIFYPIPIPHYNANVNANANANASTINASASTTNDDPASKYNGKKMIIIEPINFHGAQSEDLEPFGLVEDMEWRLEMSNDNAAGCDGYLGDAMDTFMKTATNNNSNNDTEEEEEGQASSTCTVPSTIIPIDERSGVLWEFGKQLQKEGFVLDSNGYSCCFRVNRKQQNKELIHDDDFDRLSVRLRDRDDANANESTNLGLASSVNLGCIDFYPIKSGKKNCCSYLAHKFSKSSSSMNDLDMKMNINIHDETNMNTNTDIILKRAICFCDDDNDLEMAMSCGKAYLPSISSLTMADACKKYPNQIIITEDKEADIVETKATEHALICALNVFSSRSELRP